MLPIQCLKNKHPNIKIPTTIKVWNPIQRIIKVMGQNATSLCIDEEHKLLHQAKIEGGKPTIKAIQQKLNTEKTARVYQKLWNIQGTTAAGIMYLHVPQDKMVSDYNECKEWISVDTPKEIEDHLRNRNQKHFGQAHGTFPTIPPFSEWVDWGATSHMADLILEGEFNNQETTTFEQALL